MRDDDEKYSGDIARKARSKLAAQHEQTSVVGLGLGMFGAVGWSVALPTVLGALAGAWWDRHHPGTRSYTLVLLVAGLVLGCANAWRWFANADADIRSKSPGRHD